MCESTFRFASCCLVSLAVSMLGLTFCKASDSDPASLEFFEARIRPVLIEHCYECHNSIETHESNLRLDLRDGILKGGDTGPSVVPGSPEKSLLLTAINHANPDLKMPPTGVKLSDQVIEDFRRWIAAGATDPRDKPPTADQMAESKSWDKVLESRKKWWSFQPIVSPKLPLSDSTASTAAPIDQLIHAKLQAADLKPAEMASDEVLIRRLYFNLIGLPPSLKQLRDAQEKLKMSRSQSQLSFEAAWEKLVDQVLADQRFGERWARHWMDWIRYAESHGSEGDPIITNAWMYRDYLIRSLNQDVPMDQMIREHIAGDLIAPRVDEKLGLNESLIATAHWRMVFHGFSPTDALDERVRFIDDQINAFSKAFLGVTVSCARCHDHKFDPISQADYYALFGVLSSCRPGRSPAESFEVLHQHRDQLVELKKKLRAEFVQMWQASLASLPDRLQATLAAAEARKPDQLSLLEKQFWGPVLDRSDGKLLQAVKAGDWQSKAMFFWDLNDAQVANKWIRTGVGLEHLTVPGEIIALIAGDRAIDELHSGGITSRSISDKDSARLSSPDFVCPKDSVVWILAEGDGGASFRYVVQNYPRNGTIYPTQNLSPGLQWYKFDIGYWAGDKLHIEVTTARDAPLLTGDRARSWFRVSQACVLPRDVAPPAPRLMQGNWNGRLSQLDSATASKDATSDKTEFLRRFASQISTSVARCADGVATQDDVELLNACLKLNLLVNDLGSMQPSAKKILEQLRQVESQIPISNRIPCLEETAGIDAPLFVRGDHKRPDKVVPRRFLEAIDATAYETSSSGRLQLADRVLADSNPLTRRVMANRIWHHLFGAGIVTTPDNFGRLGSTPSNPELLDYLADQLKSRKWSLKAMIRMIVCTDAWRRSSVASAEAHQRDPNNELLSHANVRRYEAEAIRDAILAATGNLDSEMFGPPVANERTRRSIYLPVIRNSLNPLMRTFDFPEPFSTVGRRDQTNVPAQSLTLMNDPFLARQAEVWAANVIARNELSGAQLHEMIVSAFSRDSTAEELEKLNRLYKFCHQRIASTAAEYQQAKVTVDQLGSSIADLQSSTRNQIIQSRRAAQSNQPANEKQSVDADGKLRPLLQWRFDSASTVDNVNRPGGLKLVGNAKIENGALTVGQDAYAVSNPIKKALREKTLVALVQFDNLNQRGGGVVTVQSSDGIVFDSIVFAEQNPQQWLSGSNNFARTKSFEGTLETAAISKPVHIAIAYDPEGTIRAYRDGKPYGTAYKSAGVQEFAADQSVVTLGLRHLPAGGNRFFSGKIFRAQLFDRALSADEVQSLASDTEFISEEELLAAMSSAQRLDLATWQSELAKAEQRLRSLKDALPVQINQAASGLSEADLERLSLAQVARTLFTLKEFIYVP